jgi:hypothetical protein
MKNTLILGVLAFFMTSSTPKFTNNQEAEEDYFKIEVVQNGKVIKVKNHVIKLEKAPFVFKLTYYKTNHVYMSSSWGTYYYDYSDDKNIFECNDDSFFKECRFVSVKTGNEDKFNVNKDIYVGDDSYQNVWFYKENIDWYRMDEGVTVKDGVIHATVTVENIYDMDKRDERSYEEHEYKYQIENIDQNIYIVFATENYEKGMEHPEELQREKFILKFK